jgi:hypothetical protein
MSAGLPTRWLGASCSSCQPVLRSVGECRLCRQSVFTYVARCHGVPVRFAAAGHPRGTQAGGMVVRGGSMRTRCRRFKPLASSISFPGLMPPETLRALAAAVAVLVPPLRMPTRCSRCWRGRRLECGGAESRDTFEQCPLRRGSRRTGGTCSQDHRALTGWSVSSARRPRRDHDCRPPNTREVADSSHRRPSITIRLAATYRKRPGGSASHALTHHRLTTRRWWQRLQVDQAVTLATISTVLASACNPDSLLPPSVELAGADGSSPPRV